EDTAKIYITEIYTVVTSICPESVKFEIHHPAAWCSIFAARRHMRLRISPESALMAANLR
ncbi:MAG: hypothetical protein AAF679_03865, partial [Pseudomonadota bacterium]